MGLFSKIKKLFKSKYDKIERSEVCDSIIKLNSELEQIEMDIEKSKQSIDKMLAEGKNVKDQNMRLFLAKKINFLKNQQQQQIQRSTYLMYNISLLEKLKVAIDDNQFFANSQKQPLNSLLGDQKALATFLNKALNTRINAEEILTSADETFENVASSYEMNSKIYGTSASDDELLAMFEENDSMNDSLVPNTEEKEESISEVKGE